MLKFMFVMIIILFLGCWNIEYKTNIPDFAKKTIEINSTKNVLRYLLLANQTNEEFLDSNFINSLKNKGFDNIIKKIFETAKDTLCSDFKKENVIFCNEGRITETYLIYKKNNFCFIEHRKKVDGCKKEIESNLTTINGYTTTRLKTYITSSDLPIVGYESTYNFALEGNKNWRKYSYFKLDLKYEINNSKFNYTNKAIQVLKENIVIKSFEKNKLKRKLSLEKVLYGMFRMVELFHCKRKLNGWVIYKDKYLDGNNYKTKQYGIAYKKFVIDSNITNNISYMNVNGKIGDTCTGGLVKFETNITLEDNITNKKLPYKGKLILKGANKTKATATFFKGENQNFVKINLKNGNKIYSNWYEIIYDANLSECVYDINISWPNFNL